jgi:hypothetical protein
MLLHQQLETDRTLVTPLTSEIAEGVMARDHEMLNTEFRLKFPP